MNYKSKFRKAFWEEDNSASHSRDLPPQAIEKARETAGNTAIKRKTLSQPVKHLINTGALDRLKPNSRVLDYGCGRGSDIEYLQSLYPEVEIVGYDPNHRPQKPKGKFDLILNNYVLNVVADKADRNSILDDILYYLKPSGIAYISVRDDRESLKGVTSKGTYQDVIKLRLPVHKHSSGSFVMYRMTHHEVENLKSKTASKRRSPFKSF